ncbi:hypothetical protein [Variovorax sp. E3]|uniref:hypothetical protein n=1 Tax=Variovorax sp. E3 TaxID=1914993 RepID=UPI0018DE5D0A|nr:hypothetical protein [Variovorax sp. E3]
MARDVDLDRGRGGGAFFFFLPRLRARLLARVRPGAFVRQRDRLRDLLGDLGPQGFQSTLNGASRNHSACINASAVPTSNQCVSSM